MRYYGKQVIMKGGHMESFPIKELIREADSDEEKSDCIMNTFKDKVKSVDKMAKVSIKKTQLTASAMKCYCSCNHYGGREKIINEGTRTDECPRCSESETWEHVVKYRSTVSMIAEFILKCHHDLKRVKVPGVTEEELRTFIEDIKNS